MYLLKVKVTKTFLKPFWIIHVSGTFIVKHTIQIQYGSVSIYIN